FYNDPLRPRVSVLGKRREQLGPHPQSLLADASGEILEVGFGSGLNLPFYPSHVRRVTAVEPHAGMIRRAKQHVAASDLEVRTITLGADQALPLPGGSFDAVVSTWTLCSIRDVGVALRQVHRLLRPGGKLLFLEHGLSPDAKVA